MIRSNGSLGVASSAQVAGLQSELPQLVVTALLSVRQSGERWVRWAALSQPHHRRPLITVTTITGITAITVTDTTRAGENITVLTADKPWRAPQAPRQMRLRATRGRYSCAARSNAGPMHRQHGDLCWGYPPDNIRIVWVSAD
jgi:hypothetical protein